jgi:hypothetical protein
MNPRCSPRPVLGHHTKDQVPHFSWSWPSAAPQSSA